MLIFFNNLHMRSKLMISFLLIMMVPLFVSSYMAVSLKRITYNSTVTQVKNSSNRVKERIEQIMSTAVSVSTNLSYDPNLNRLVFRNYRDEFERITEYWEKGNYTSYLRAYQHELEDIHLYIDRQDVLNTGFIRNTPSYIRETSWYKEVLAGIRYPIWLYLSNDSFIKRGLPVVALARPIINNDSIYGVLVLYINMASLGNIVSQEDEETIICTSEGVVIAGTDPKTQGKSLQDIGLKLTESGNSLTVDYNGIPVNVFRTETATIGTRHNLSVLSIISSDRITAEVNRTIVTEYILLLIGIAACVLLILILSKLLSQRLSMVTKDIRRVTCGDFDFIPQIDGKDEIGQLAADFSSMVMNTQRLIKEVYETNFKQKQLENHQKDIQLQVLNSQLNPHFLFNALEGIRMRLVINNDGENALAIQQLSKLLRRSLNIKKRIVPLSEELEFTGDYLALQKIRFRERLSFRVDIMANITKQTIPPFTLLPIVENAVKHGLENLSDGRNNGYITLCIENQQPGVLSIRITDNGLGINYQMLKEIEAQLNTPVEAITSDHVGIINVHQRLRLNYGEPYGLSILSSEGRGTIITIIIPYLCETGEIMDV